MFKLFVTVLFLTYLYDATLRGIYMQGIASWFDLVDFYIYNNRLYSK